jgi:hypothetical protein
VKQRKKLWIACAALVVVVALCAAALLYQPVPYRFLEGSQYLGNEIVGYAGTERTHHAYRVHGTFDSVVESARLELTPKEGWSVHVYPKAVELKKARKIVAILDDTPGRLTGQGSSPDVRETVHVGVSEPTTLLDRVLSWMSGK